MLTEKERTNKEDAGNEDASVSHKPRNPAWKKLLRSIVFLIGLAIILSCASFVMEPKTASTRLTLFFEQDTSYDVMYFGTSHVLNGFIPYELWEEYGITSYNFGANGMHLPSTYWLIKNVLDYAEPKLILIDCSKLSSDTMSSTTIEQAHNVWDAFPLTKNKWLAIEDMFEPEDRLEFLWKFSIYHNRWGELTKNDFHTSYSTNYGAVTYFTVKDPKEFIPIPDSSKSKADTNGVIYLRKTIELCQSRGIEVILTYLPFPASSSKQREANRAADIAEEYGIPYLNFLKMDGIVNFNTDLKDTDHLNFSGACKITSYLGKYFVENYGFSSHKGEEAFQQWNTDYQQYTSETKYRFSTQKSLDANLLLLSNRKYSSAIYIRRDSVLLQDEHFLSLIKNTCPYSDFSRLLTASAEGEEYFLFTDNRNNTFFECIGSETAADAESFLTPIRYETEPDGSRTMSVGDIKYRLESGTSAPDIQIAVIGSASGKIIKTMAFYVTASAQKLTATRGAVLEHVDTGASPDDEN